MTAFLRTLFLFGFVLLASTSSLAAPAVSFPAPSAPIARVTLYPDSALIERAARVRAGAESLEIAGIPANFDVETIRVEADSGIEIGELVWRDSARDKPLNAEEARLEAEVQKLSDQLSFMDAERKAAERELKYLETLASPAVSLAALPSAQAVNPTRALEVIRQGSLQAERRILNVATQKRDLEKKLNTLKADLARIRPDVDTVRALSVRLWAKTDGEVRVSYLLGNAGWRPAYRATLDTERGVVRLERTARIAQRSGEDWRQVRLSLSTSAPRQSASGPQPYPWNIDLLEPLRPLSKRTQGLALAAEMAAPVMMDAQPRHAAEVPLFGVEAAHGDYASEYAIPGTLSLPADGRKVAVSLDARNISVTLEAETAPRLEKVAYLVARGQLPEGVWPEGDMRLYRDGAYIGGTRWSADQNDPNLLLLPFGRDDLIQIGHQSREDQKGQGGFVTQHAERRLIDTYTVTNRHRRDIDIRVLESSPVGRNDAVEVERRFTPNVSEEDWRGQKGVVAWKHRLGAGQSADFTADYRVRWPKDRQIIGLP